MTKLRIQVTDGMGGWANFEVVVDDQGELRRTADASPLTARKQLKLNPTDWLCSPAEVNCTVEVVE